MENNETFEVKSFSLDQGARLVMVPSASWLPAFSYSIVLSGQNLQAITLKILERNPAEPMAKSLYSESDRGLILLRGDNKDKVDAAKAAKWIYAETTFPNGEIATFHKANGELKIGHCGFDLKEGIYPEVDYYWKIVEVVINFLHSKKGKLLRLPEKIDEEIKYSANLATFNAKLRELCLTEPEIEYDAGRIHSL